MERPTDRTFTVTVEDNDAFQWSWNGYASNVTDAMYKALESWEGFIQRQASKGTES